MTFFDQNSAPAISGNLANYTFRGHRRTDRRTDRQTRFWNPHMETCRHPKKISTQSSKLIVSRRSLYASPEVGDA